jgi:hypothetical protein
LSSSFSSTRDSLADTVQSKRQDSKLLFYKIVAAYVECKGLSVVSAINIDPNSRTRKQTSDTVHYAIDVQRATEKALNGDPTLEAAWFALAQGHTCDPNAARKVIAACSRLYSARCLDPQSYFRNIRKGSAIGLQKAVA